MKYEHELRSKEGISWRLAMLKYYRYANSFKDLIIMLFWFTSLILPRRYFNNLHNYIMKNICWRFKNKKYYVNTLNELLYFINSEYEKDIQEWFNCPEDGIFLDAGANVGLYTILYSDVKKVISFEPNKNTFFTLCKNIEVNKLNNVYAYQLALLNENKTVDFLVYNSSGNDSVMGILQTKSGLKRIDKVKAIRFDDMIEDYYNYFIDRLDLIKMDIEGAELEALKGMETSIIRFRPRLIVELKEPIKIKIDYITSLGLKYIDNIGENYLFDWNDEK